MMDAQPAAAPVPASLPAHYNTRGREDQIAALNAVQTARCGSATTDEVIICGGRQEEKFRLRPPTDDYPVENALGHPFHVQILPGLALDGLTLSVQFGPW